MICSTAGSATVTWVMPCKPDVFAACELQRASTAGLHGVCPEGVCWQIKGRFQMSDGRLLHKRMLTERSLILQLLCADVHAQVGTCLMSMVPLQSAQRKLFDVANSLGLSDSVLKVIDRRQKLDKQIVYGGMVGPFQSHLVVVCPPLTTPSAKQELLNLLVVQVLVVLLVLLLLWWLR